MKLLIVLGIAAALVPVGAGAAACPGGTVEQDRCVLPLALTFARVGGVRTASTHQVGGFVFARGRFTTHPPDDVLAVGQGLAVRVRDGGSVDRTFRWSAAECAVRSGIKCLSADHRLKLVLPHHATYEGLKLLLVKLDDLRGPFTAPVTVSLLQDDAGLERRGTADACATVVTGILQCRAGGS